MSNLYQLHEKLLADRKITEAEVDVIRDYIDSNGQLDLEDMKFLVNLLSEAKEVCADFDALFFPALKKIVLADGQIRPDEQFFLLKMLYSDGVVREIEKKFLRELHCEAKEITPEFEALCNQAFATDGTDWDVGGHAGSTTSQYSVHQSD